MYLLCLFYLAAGAYTYATMDGQNLSKNGFKLPLTRVLRRTRPIRSVNIAMNKDNRDLYLTNVNEFSYLLPICVGAHCYSVIFDTGSSDLWLLSNECSTSDCNHVPTYSNDSSANLSVSDRPFKINYLQGSVTGVVAFETVTVSNFKIVSQVFGLVKEVEDMSLSSTGNSGIIGLSFPSEASIPSTVGPSFLQNVFGSLKEPYFAFKLGTQSGPNDITSSFTFGQLDPRFAEDTSNFLDVPVSSAGANNYTYWKIPLLKLTMNGTDIPLSRSSVSGADHPIAVLDSGTTMVLGCSKDVETFWRFVGLGSAARLNPLTMMYEVRCDKAVNVGFVLGLPDNNREFFIDPADISWAEGGQSEGWCIGGIQANDGVSSGDWLLGGIFLRNVYTYHRGANVTHGPSIGLLGTTDKQTALKSFRNNRGPDLDSCSICKIQSGLSSKPLLSSASVYAVSCMCGFLGGTLLTTLYRARNRLISIEMRRDRRNCPS